MKVTIIIPVYGVEKYIRECAVSLFSQSYEDIEYIFCDDCTPDRSMEILQEVRAEYPQRKVRMIRNERNLGLGGTRKALIKEIRSEAFLIVDSDDVLPVDAVEKLVGRMKETDTDIVDGAYAELSDGRMGGKTLPCHDRGDRYVRKALCQNLVSLRVWGRLYKTSVLQQVPDLFLEGIDFAEDICAMSRLVAVCSRSWTDEVVYHYRTDNMSSYSQNISEKAFFSYLRAMTTVLSFYRERGHLPFSLEIGILNTMRDGRRRGFDLERIDNALGYAPEHFRALLIYRMLHSEKIPLRISDALYRFFRIIATL